ncbi:hypothetical protein J7F03_20420 [Streptomyces sp. ISL-43]|uniref:uL30 family ribosomal protein n=1 Tax=Streptomyces sp. ISL-43 TaxID=2819183 RepID=UPI001BE6FCE5|nr:uL30 family ribosomal protein [Streptomyces sp. ISL-43]MBT2449413.1 hypothetical protein [Streptomyces sp. ISL-43]
MTAIRKKSARLSIGEAKHARPDWRSEIGLFKDSVIVELKKSGEHGIRAVKGTLRSIGLKRVGDVVVLANNRRNLGKIRRVRENVKIADPASPAIQAKLNQRKAAVMDIRNYRNGQYVGRIATFQTTKEYASLEHYDGYSILAWTSPASYQAMLAMAMRFLINSGSVHVFIGSDTIDPDQELDAETAESILRSDESIDFVRVNGGPEALSLHDGLEHEVGLSLLLQLSFLFKDIDQKRMLELLEEAGSPLVRTRADDLLRNLLVLKKPSGEER